MNAFDRLRDQEDEGFSITELLVTMLVTGVLLAMVGTFFANLARITTWSGNDRIAMGTASLALDQIRTVVRVAVDNPTSTTTTDPAVVAASGTSLALTAYSNTSNAASAAAPTKVTFQLNAAGALNEMRQVGTKAANGYWEFKGAITTRRIAGPFDTTPTTQFFTYLNASGTVLNANGASLSSAQRQTVTFIRVTATVDNIGLSGSDDPVIVTSSIGMPNVSRDVSTSITVPALPTPTATPTPTPTITSTPAASATPSATATATPTSTPTSSSTPSGGTGTGGTGTGSATPSATPSSGGSGTPTATPTGGTGGSATPSATTSTTPPSASPTATATAVPPMVSPTPTPSPTRVIQ